MKRKSIFTFCAIALMLVLSLSVLTACNKDGKHKEYTITFDSKGGSAVQPIKASAGAAITAPTDPTKDGFVFAGWYESTDGGTTLSDTAFSFSYMPARVFTLYAKWATADIKGKTFNKVDATIEWESEAAKQALLADMGKTEEEFIQMQNHRRLRSFLRRTKIPRRWLMINTRAKKTVKAASVCCIKSKVLPSCSTTAKKIWKMKSPLTHTDCSSAQRLSCPQIKRPLYRAISNRELERLNISIALW